MRLFNINAIITDDEDSAVWLKGKYSCTASTTTTQKTTYYTLTQSTQITCRKISEQQHVSRALACLAFSRRVYTIYSCAPLSECGAKTHCCRDSMAYVDCSRRKSQPAWVKRMNGDRDPTRRFSRREPHACMHGAPPLFRHVHKLQLYDNAWRICVRLLHVVAS